MATITKRRWVNKSGEHEAWLLAFTDAAGVRHREQFAKKREADARRVEVEGQVSSGAYRAAARTKTVHDACESYLEYLELSMGRGECTEHYFRTVKGQLLNYVSPQAGRDVTFENGIGQVVLSQLTTRSVVKLRDDLRGAGVGVVTARRILGSLNRAIKFARSQDWIATNPVEGVTVSGKRGEGARKVVPPSKAALAALIKAADIDLAVRIKFAAASGLRASEQWALPWSHVDLGKGEVFVDRRLDAYGNIDVTKSEAGTRMVPLGKVIIAALKELKSRSEKSDGDDLVFPSAKGAFVYHRNYMKRYWRPLVQKVKEADESLRADGWHSLRHFAISTWIEAGLQPKTIQTFAGHSSLAVTMDRYGHLFPADDHRDAMDRISGALFT